MTKYTTSFDIGEVVQSKITRDYDTAQGNKARIIPGLKGTVVKRTPDPERLFKYKVKFSEAIDISNKHKGGTMVLNLNGLSTEEIERLAPVYP